MFSNKESVRMMFLYITGALSNQYPDVLDSTTALHKTHQKEHRIKEFIVGSLSWCSVPALEDRVQGSNSEEQIPPALSVPVKKGEISPNVQ